MRTLVRATFMTMIALVFVMASVADAATTYTDTIDGAEYAATSQTGWFAGTASGDLPGTFDTMVQHTPLSPDGTITGGTFALYTVVAGSAATVTGTFVPGGTVTLLTKGNACKDQVYAVSGTRPNGGVDPNYLYGVWPAIALLSFGAGTFPPAALAYLGDVINRVVSGTSFGIYSLIFGTGLIVGPIMGGALTVTYGPVAFAIIALSLILISAVAVLFLREPARNGKEAPGAVPAADPPGNLR